MAIGPGKYDTVCSQVREQTQAVAVAVLVFGGIHGDGFSVQTSDLALLAQLPRILRSTADQIEASGGKA
jgi:hypothetical protein